VGQWFLVYKYISKSELDMWERDIIVYIMVSYIRKYLVCVKWNSRRERDDVNLGLGRMRDTSFLTITNHKFIYKPKAGLELEFVLHFAKNNKMLSYAT
jgi:hypothetical protein